MSFSELSMPLPGNVDIGDIDEPPLPAVGPVLLEPAEQEDLTDHLAFPIEEEDQESRAVLVVFAGLGFEEP